MKRVLTLILITIVAVLPGFIIKADPLFDSNDIFDVKLPTPNQKVAGTTNISWRMYDNDQTAQEYTIQLFDAATCKNNNYLNIVQSNGVSSNSINSVYAWDTKKTEQEANLKDGKYCLEICAAFKKGSDPYSACNSRFVSIVNTNQLPTITSTPDILTVNENDSWQYQIKATDPDGDTLKYLLVYGTDFLTINSQTGLLQTNNISKALPPNVSRADYRIVVGVDDGISGTTTQEFTLSVVKAGGTGGTNSPTDITFLTPKENDVLKGTSNNISWTAYDSDGIDQITLSYSKDNATWQNITTSNDPQFSEYNWDVSSIPDGAYYLQLSVKDLKGAVVSRSSKQFNIQNNQGVNNNLPMVISFYPQDGQELSDTTFNITGKFASPEGAQIDSSSFKISLDDQDITSTCTVDAQSFTCPVKDLAQGKHSVNISIKDSNGAEGKFSSSFTITNQAPVSSPQGIVIFGQTIPQNILIIGGIILLLCCLLLVIPWLLFTLWSGRHKTQETKTTLTTQLLPAASPQTTAADLTVSPLDMTYTPPAGYNESFEAPKYDNVPTTQGELTTNYYNIDNPPSVPPLSKVDTGGFVEEVPAAPPPPVQTVVEPVVEEPKQTVVKETVQVPPPPPTVVVEPTPTAQDIQNAYSSNSTTTQPSFSNQAFEDYMKVQQPAVSPQPSVVSQQPPVSQPAVEQTYQPTTQAPISQQSNTQSTTNQSTTPQTEAQAADDFLNYDFHANEPIKPKDEFVEPPPSD